MDHFYVLLMNDLCLWFSGSLRVVNVVSKSVSAVCIQKGPPKYISVHIYPFW
jgi:hypothetical protein